MRKVGKEKREREKKKPLKDLLHSSQPAVTMTSETEEEEEALQAAKNVENQVITFFLLHNGHFLAAKEIRKFFRNFRNFSEFFEIFRNFSEFFGIFWNFSEFIHTFDSIALCCNCSTFNALIFFFITAEYRFFRAIAGFLEGR